jgi:hypothetical protein
MSNIVLLVSAEGRTESFANTTAKPVRIDLPEGAVIGWHDAMSGEWQPLVPDKPRRHRIPDFSVLDE